MVSNITWHISLLFSLLAPSVTLPSLPSFNDLKEHTRLPALNSNMQMSLHNSGRGSHREVRRTGHRWWFRDHRVHLSGSGSKRTLGGLFCIPASALVNLKESCRHRLYNMQEWGRAVLGREKGLYSYMRYETWGQLSTSIRPQGSHLKNMVSTVRIKQITDFFFGLSWKNILQQIKKLVELVLPSFYFQSIWLTNSCPLTMYPARCWPFREVKRSWPSPEGVDGWKVFHLTIIYLNKQKNKQKPGKLPPGWQNSAE